MNMDDTTNLISTRMLSGVSLDRRRGICVKAMDAMVISRIVKESAVTNSLSKVSEMSRILLSLCSPVFLSHQSSCFLSFKICSLNRKCFGQEGSNVVSSAILSCVAGGGGA